MCKKGGKIFFPCLDNSKNSNIYALNCPYLCAMAKDKGATMLHFWVFLKDNQAAF